MEMSENLSSPEFIAETDKIIWASDDGSFEAIVPQKGTIPIEEGINIGIKKAGEFDWRKADFKDLAKSVVLAIGTARLITESYFSPDFWANIHLNSAYGSSNRVNVFGRNPRSEKAWTKPVIIQDVLNGEEKQQINDNLKTLIKTSLPFWEKLSSRICPFRDGINLIDPDSDEFKELQIEYIEKPDVLKENVLWANKKFVLVSVLKPHLNGLHLVLHPRKDYWSKKGNFLRPWQQETNDDFEHIEAMVEAVAILAVAKDLVENQGPSFYNPEIHFSGNWTQDLLPLDKGGKLNMENVPDENNTDFHQLNLRWAEKNRHKVNSQQEFKVGVHGHLYMTSSSQDFVRLPERPIHEVPEQWANITPTDPRVINTIKNQLQNNLEIYIARKVKEI
jgi:hypothetical protein